MPVLSTFRTTWSTPSSPFLSWTQPRFLSIRYPMISLADLFSFDYVVYSHDLMIDILPALAHPCIYHPHDHKINGIRTAPLPRLTDLR